MPFDGSNYDTPVTNPVTELLEQAWSLIDKPQKWCRGHYHSPDGRRFCSLGALQAALFQRYVEPVDYYQARILLDRAMSGYTALFNDSSSHRQVADAWQRAIAASRNHG